MRFLLHLQRAWNFCRRVLDRYNGDRGPLAAAAIAFFSLLSAVPFMFLGLAILGEVLGMPRARDAIHEALLQFLQEDRVVESLDRLARAHTAMAGLGTVGLIWAAAQVFIHLEIALDVAWRSEAGRHFLVSRMLAFVMTIVAGLMLLAATLTTWLLDGLRALARELLPATGSSWIWSGAHQALPFALTLVAFAGLYKVMPNARVRPSAAWVGAMAGALMWEALKWLFALYLKQLPHLEPLYGSLGGLIAVFVWIYYSSVALVLGAEIGAIYQEGLTHPPTRVVAPKQGRSRRTLAPQRARGKARR